jgi:ankyrin repeat protein
MCSSGGNLPEECNKPTPSIDEVDAYLRHGANPNLPVMNDNHCTAMHYAARYGHKTVRCDLHIISSVESLSAIGKT